MRKYLNERHRKAAMAEARRQKLAGDGVYLYQNMSRATLVLGKPCSDGRTHIGPMARFEGDSFFKSIKECVCLATLQDPAAKAQAEPEIQAPEEPITESVMAEEKLITEVPPTVTHEGKVEYVQAQPGEEPINESQPQGKGKKKKDVLLSEAPVDSIRIMR